ncbi:unnamed protein product [Vitrella brassicaformis CCMP3155]|uniref:Uncharacterized protein n=1 Tax=Vitrella brassicaformis (strain CCMP3155) TaxID=1169540 RepID=A0A0G4GZ93_VITBC|nr:unnamed protein product [Vitrella brassicaformis CCMP3155]|eukprot:CEM36575.1 unnamed protein product [Vitrella brassicaformis CCMP3155]
MPSQPDSEALDEGTIPCEAPFTTDGDTSVTHTATQQQVQVTVENGVRLPEVPGIVHASGGAEDEDEDASPVHARPDQLDQIMAPGSPKKIKKSVTVARSFILHDEREDSLPVQAFEKGKPSGLPDVDLRDLSQRSGSVFDGLYHKTRSRLSSFVSSVKEAFGDDDSIITTWVMGGGHKKYCGCEGPLGEMLFIVSRIALLIVLPTTLGLIWNTLPLHNQRDPWHKQMLYFWGYLPMFRLLIGSLPCTWIPGFLNESVTLATFSMSFFPGLLGHAITLAISAAADTVGVPAHAFLIGIPIFGVQGRNRWLFCTTVCMFAPALWMAAVFVTFFVVLAASNELQVVEFLLVFAFPFVGHYLVEFARAVLRRTRRKMEIGGAMLPLMVTTMYMSILFPTILEWIFWVSTVERCLFIIYPAYKIITEHHACVRRITASGVYKEFLPCKKMTSLTDILQCISHSFLLICTFGYGMPQREVALQFNPTNVQQMGTDAQQGDRGQMSMPAMSDRHERAAKYLPDDHNADIEKALKDDKEKSEETKPTPEPPPEERSHRDSISSQGGSVQPAEREGEAEGEGGRRKSDEEIRAERVTQKRRTSVVELVASNRRRSSVASIVQDPAGHLLSIYTIDDSVFENVTQQFAIFLVQAFTEIFGPFQVHIYVRYIRDVSPSSELYPAFTELSDKVATRFMWFTVFTTLFNTVTSYIVLSIVKPYLPVARRKLILRFLGDTTFFLVMLGSLTISPVYPIVLLTPHNQFPLDLSVTRTGD